MQNPYIHLKCSTDRDQIEDRLKYRPHLIEIQLFEKDIDSPSLIVETIKRLKEHDTKVILHHPMKVNGKYLDILSDDLEVYNYYRRSCEILNEICYTQEISCVVHPHYDHCISGTVDTSDIMLLLERSEVMREAIAAIRDITCDRFLWENSPRGVFSGENPYWISDIVQHMNLPLCYDISHAFMSFRGDNIELEKNIISAFPFTLYYHVVDSQGSQIHDALTLGSGRIDWGRLRPYILQRDFIFEIELPDYTDCTPMIQSAKYFESL